MTSPFVAPELRPDDTRPRRRDLDPPEPQTWRCLCGCPLYEHSLQRVTSTSVQITGGCQVDGCGCEKGEAELVLTPEEEDEAQARTQERLRRLVGSARGD